MPFAVEFSQRHNKEEMFFMALPFMKKRDLRVSTFAHKTRDFSHEILLDACKQRVVWLVSRTVIATCGNFPHALATLIHEKIMRVRFALKCYF